MIFLPGADGTGQAVLPQVPGLHRAGYEVYALNIPPDDRSGWPALVAASARLITQLLAARAASAGDQVTLFGESFGGALALRVAAAHPDLVAQLVLLNPATSFGQSLGGVASIVSSTNLLSLFPPVMYRAAQATMLPLLVDRSRLSAQGALLMRAMIEMRAGDAVGGGAASRAPPDLPPLPLSLLPTDLVPSAAAAAANFRAGLLRDGGAITADQLAAIQAPSLVISSARDRLLPSLQEGARLVRALPRARRVILPDSGHAATLERGVDIGALIVNHPVLPAAMPAATPTPTPAPAQQRRQLVSSPATTHRTDGFRATNDLPAGPSRRAAAPSNSNGLPRAVHQQEPAPVPQLTAAQDASDPFEEWAQILAPWRDLVSPLVLGADRLPPPGSLDFARPMLFVGNHQRVGFYDTPLLVYELAIRGYKVRGLAHPGHWSGPVGPFFQQFGAVKASPMAAYRLLRGNEKVLLFPGGAKEVNKPRGSEYTLSWKVEPDFVRLAAKVGALIVPFAAVGADDAYEVMMDAEEVLAHPVLGPLASSLLRRFDPTIDVREAVLPITKLPGLGLPSPIPVPNLNRLYFRFSDPIDTRALQLDVNDTEAVAALYADVRRTVETSIQELLELRSEDEGASVMGRLSKAVAGWPGVMADATRAQGDQEPPELRP